MPTIDKAKIKGECLNGAYSELASTIGIDAVLRIHSKYRGTSMFFPVELYSREFILSQIVNEYNGKNIKQIRIHRKRDTKNFKRPALQSATEQKVDKTSKL